MLLFALMGIARWLVLREPGPEGAERGARWRPGVPPVPCFLSTHCRPSSEEAALLGTLATAGLAVLALGRVAEVPRRAAELVLVVLLWLAYATAVAVGSLLVRATASVRRPRLGVVGQRDDPRGEPAGDHVGQADVLEHGAQAGA